MNLTRKLKMLVKEVEMLVAGYLISLRTKSGFKVRNQMALLNNITIFLKQLKDH